MSALVAQVAELKAAARPRPAKAANLRKFVPLCATQTIAIYRLPVLATQPTVSV
jgi:hypothetical protein